MSEREMTVTESLLVEINRLRAENDRIWAEVEKHLAEIERLRAGERGLTEETEWGLKRAFNGSILTHWSSREVVEQVIAEERADEFGIECSLVSRRVLRSEWTEVPDA